MKDNAMSYISVRNCPACKSGADIDRVMGFTGISCSRIECTLSTNLKESLDDAIEEWDERCRLYPKPHPSDLKKLK